MMVGNVATLRMCWGGRGPAPRCWQRASATRRPSWPRASSRWRRAQTGRSASTTWTRLLSSTTTMRPPTSQGASEDNNYRKESEEWHMILIRCLHHLGKNGGAIEDAIMAVERQSYSGNILEIKYSIHTWHILVPAKEALGTALYSSGYFEKALIQFHKSNRLRQSSCYDEWIGRCEETIKAYLIAANIDAGTVRGGYF